VEACHIVVQETSRGVYDVGAPMKYKPLCYNILADARKVIFMTSDEHFSPIAKVLTITMNMEGRVDVAAPLPPRQMCEHMLASAKGVIERYDDEQAPVMRKFSDVLMGV